MNARNVGIFCAGIVAAVIANIITEAVINRSRTIRRFVEG